MRLSSFFIPMLAYVQGLERVASPVAAQVHGQIQSLIAQAREAALQENVSLTVFESALFPVVAWTDERLARMPAWRTSRDWRGFMLQRQLFSTGHAGVEFFERLQALEPEAFDVREVYVMCLGLGFVGRYSQEPNSLELARLREEHYRSLLSRDGLTSAEGYMPLFPEAYRVVTGHGQQKRSMLRAVLFWGLVIGLPLAVIAVFLFWGNQTLNAQVLKITKGLLW